MHTDRHPPRPRPGLALAALALLFGTRLRRPDQPGGGRHPGQPAAGRGARRVPGRTPPDPAQPARPGAAGRATGSGPGTSWAWWSRGSSASRTPPPPVRAGPGDRAAGGRLPGPGPGGRDHRPAAPDRPPDPVVGHDPGRGEGGDPGRVHGNQADPEEGAGADHRHPGSSAPGDCLVIREDGGTTGVPVGPQLYPGAGDRGHRGPPARDRDAAGAAGLRERRPERPHPVRRAAGDGRQERGGRPRAASTTRPTRPGRRRPHSRCGCGRGSRSRSARRTSSWRTGTSCTSRRRDTEVYYTAGLLGGGQFPLPRDYDLDVMQAIAAGPRPAHQRGFTQNAFVAQSVNTRDRQPEPEPGDGAAAVCRTAGSSRSGWT